MLAHNMINMSKNRNNKAKNHLPSTTKIGGRMTTRSYARAVIEGVRLKEAVKVGMEEEDRMAEAEREANRKLIEAVDKAEAEHENKKQKKKKKKLKLKSLLKPK